MKMTYIDSPLSEEERNYPLAYGMLVFKDPLQVYTMLSAFYHPQNAYCIAVDIKATKDFKADMERLGLCFPNIFVIVCRFPDPNSQIFEYILFV
jgi:hypothetical protein